VISKAELKLIRLIKKTIISPIIDATCDPRIFPTGFMELRRIRIRKTRARKYDFSESIKVAKVLTPVVMSILYCKEHKKKSRCIY
jgi:hypothetical protein